MSLKSAFEMLKGVIADDVAKIDQNLAVFDNEGNPMNIKWMDLQTYMLAEIQQLKKQIDFLMNQGK